MPKKTEEKNKKTKKATEKPQAKKETKKVVKEEVVVRKEEKGSLLDNTPFVISTCIAIILLSSLIFSIVYLRIPTTKDGKQVLATLKGKTITADDLYKTLKDQNGTTELVNMIDEYIAEKEVKITKDDKKYVQEVVDYYKDYAEQYKTDLKTFLTNYVGLSGISTEDEFYDFVLKDYKKSLAVSQYVGDKATEKELKEYYKNNYSDSLTVKHILVQVDSDAEDSEKADKEALERAKEIIKKLDKVDSKDLDSKFEKYAKEYSDDTQTYNNGGLIEDFQKKDVEENFYNAAKKLKNGKYTAEPVKTSYGYHIILKVSSEKVKPYKEIKAEVKKAYANEKLAADSTLQVTAWDELRKEYKLSIKDTKVKKAYEKTIKDSTKTTDSNDDEKTEE